jgi:hypothetical protein
VFDTSGDGRYSYSRIRFVSVSLKGFSPDWISSQSRTIAVIEVHFLELRALACEGTSSREGRSSRDEKDSHKHRPLRIRECQ